MVTKEDVDKAYADACVASKAALYVAYADSEEYCRQVVAADAASDEAWDKYRKLKEAFENGN